MRRASRFLAAVLAGVAGLVAACVSAPLNKDDLSALAVADADELQGCFLCLTEAHDTYARLAVGKRRPVLVSRLFETDLLLALRAKELAMDPRRALDEARALVSELPVTIDATRYLADVDDITPDSIGTPESELRPMLFAQAAHNATFRDEVAWLMASGPIRAPVGRYLAIALTCSHSAGIGPGQTLFVLPPDAPPLLRYRKAICGLPDDPTLRQVHTDVPRFFEASFFLARRAVDQAKRMGPRDAKALLGEASAHFPTSPSVTYLDGNFNQLMGDCTRALTRFADTLALRPGHENALLGQVQCLSFLKRHNEAIAHATQMLAIKARPIDALYWRAWNYRELKELPQARADIEDAKARGFELDVYQLAGIIEHDQDDLNPAEVDLLSVLHSPGGSEACSAHWYLGLVYMKKTRWIDSATAFVGAYHCYETAVGVDLDEIAQLEQRTDLDPDYRASQLKIHQATLIEDRSQEHAAAYNAANHYARGGDFPKARPLLEIAAEDPALTDLVKTLRDVIK